MGNSVILHAPTPDYSQRVAQSRRSGHCRDLQRHFRVEEIGWRRARRARMLLSVLSAGNGTRAF